MFRWLFKQLHKLVHFLNLNYNVKIVCWHDKEFVYYASKCLKCGKIADVYRTENLFINDETGTQDERRIDD